MVELLLAALGGAALYLDRYRVTNHGPNHWTLEGLVNVVSLLPAFGRAIAIVNGTVDSCFRSAAVNAAVGGVKTSDHLHGRALDIMPHSLSARAARDALLEAAKRGELGNVREIISYRVKGHVHIGWRASGDRRSGIEILEKD